MGLPNDRFQKNVINSEESIGFLESDKKKKRA
jgi:hypothetical protein